MIRKDVLAASFNEFVCSYEFTFEKYMDELGMLHKSVRASPQINALWLILYRMALMDL